MLDTNILLAYLRQNDDLIQRINRDLGIDLPSSENFISVVSKAEIMTLALRNGWGEKKQNILLNLLNELIIIDIVSEPEILVQAYTEIDTFSQRKHPTRKLAKSAITMGKNDLWIAATAYALDATLVTTDSDFDHLHGEFIDVRFYKV